MKQAWKLLSVLLLTVLLAVSATAQINWMKQDGKINYLAWNDGSKAKYIKNGESATFATGYFGSTASPSVTLTVTLNSVSTGKIVSTITSQNVYVANTLGYKVIDVLPQHYQNTPGEYIVVIKLKDANTEYVDTSLYLKVSPALTISQIPPIYMIVPINPNKNTAPEMNPIDANKDILETDALQFTVSATDKENDTLTYSAQVFECFIFNICSWKSLSWVGASFNQDTGTLSWTPGYDFVQHPELSESVLFRFKANDGKKDSEWVTATIKVIDVNRNPLFEQIEPKHIKQGKDVSFTVTASDADKDKLKYSIYNTNLPQQAYTFDSKSRQFTFTHGFTTDGVYTTVFQVEDDFGGVDYAVSYIVITPAPENNDQQCHDNKDNDEDTLFDANDPGCHTDGDTSNRNSYDPNDDNESDEPVQKPRCDDGEDNDLDHKIDLDDPGCKDKNDDDETDEQVNQPQCNDGKDNDGDGLTDYGNDPRVNDPGCKGQDDNDETDEVVQTPQSQCNDVADNDLDGFKDAQDPGCHTDGNAGNARSYDPNDNDERDDTPPSVRTQCNDGIDNDGDGKIDYGNDLRVNDPGCSSNDDNDEADNIFPQPSPSQKPASFTHIKFKSAEVEDAAHPGNLMTVHVNIFNNGKTNLEDVKIKATIYDIGAFGSTSDFDLSTGKGANKSIYVPVPADAQPGWYLVKITAKNFHYHTSTYRLAYIESNTFQ